MVIKGRMEANEEKKEENDGAEGAMRSDRARSSID